MELPRVRVRKAGQARPDVPARRVPPMMRWCIRLGTFSAAGDVGLRAVRCLA